MATIKEAKVGKASIRLVKTTRGFAVAAFDNGQRKFLEEGDDAERLWMRGQDFAARLNPHFVGYDGARKRFLSFFPAGFAGNDYFEMERGYKLDAKIRLDTGVPFDSAGLMPDHGESVLAVYRATNLLSPFEKTRLQPLLRGTHQSEFLQAAAAFALGDAKASLSALRAILKPYESAKWTVITYLPFLWRPDDHMFLEPTAIRDFAQRVGHRFADDYSPDLDVSVYESLLDLSRTTRRELIDLAPRDLIDVQSFMWTTVDYKDDAPA